MLTRSSSKPPAAGALGAVVYCEVVEKGGCELVYDDNATLKVALIVSAIGAVAGGIVGYFIKTDRWEEIPLERLRVSLAPQRDGGFALGFSVRDAAAQANTPAAQNSQVSPNEGKIGRSVSPTFWTTLPDGSSTL